MRVSLPLGRRLYLLVAFLLLLLASLPLRIALDQLGFDERGLSARLVTGSLWSGRLTEARLRGAALGDLDAGLSVLPLLVGQARVGLEAATWRGTVVQSSDGAGVVGLTGRLGADGLPAALPVGAIDFTDVTARFRDGVCAEASGSLRVEPRAGAAALASVGQLQGNLRCDGEALLAPLVSGSGRERVELRLFGDARYRLSLIAQPADPTTAAALQAAGFVATADGLTLTREGSL
jgi:general secretion pathway protein N